MKLSSLLFMGHLLYTVSQKSKLLSCCDNFIEWRWRWWCGDIKWHLFQLCKHYALKTDPVCRPFFVTDWWYLCLNKRVHFVFHPLRTQII